MSNSRTIVRQAMVTDLGAINDIYNFYIENTVITFDEEPWPISQREQWFSGLHKSNHRILVATLQDKVVGFAYTAPFRPKTAYQRSAEVTIYTNQEAIKGTGSALYENLLAEAEQTFHRLYAVITLPNDQSIALHKKFGFAEVGMLDESGFKFGQYHSVAILEKRLA